MGHVFRRAIRSIQRTVSPTRFNRLVLLLAGVGLLVLYPLAVLCAPRFLPREMYPKETFPIDFGQYYTGGLAARDGIWKALYPIPREDVYGKPPVFQPVWKTALFEGIASRQPQYLYPKISSPEASSISPELVKRSPELNEVVFCRYLYPPPLAILLVPLAWFDLQTAAYKVWPIFCSVALFGAVVYSGRIYRLLRGEISYGEGVVMLLFLAFIFRGRTTDLVSGNVSPVLGFLIAFAVYSWLKGRGVAVGTAMIPLLLFKALTLTWCPLLFLRDIRWRTIATLAFWTILLNGLTWWLAGPEIYRHFFDEIVPKMAIPAGEGIVAKVFKYFGIYPAWVYTMLKGVGCAAIYWGYWRRFNEPSQRREVTIVAALAGTIAIFCIFNFCIWYHYFPNYLAFPFMGWLVWEWEQARGFWRWMIGGTIAGVGVIVGAEWMIKGTLFHLVGGHAVEWYLRFIHDPGFVLVLPALYLVFALRRLYGNSGPDIATRKVDGGFWLSSTEGKPA